MKDTEDGINEKGWEKAMMKLPKGKPKKFSVEREKSPFGTIHIKVGSDHRDAIKTKRSITKLKALKAQSFSESVEAFRACLDEGSLGAKRTQRKMNLTMKRGMSALNAADRAARSSGEAIKPHEIHKHFTNTQNKLDAIKKKGERGGRWGTDNSSPAARKHDRELAADYSQKHADILKKSVDTKNKKSPLPSDGYAYHPGFFYSRMRKHADAQGTRHPGDESGVARTARLEKPIRKELKAKAKAERRFGPKPIHPTVQAAQTKDRLKKERGERDQEKKWAREGELRSKQTANEKSAPWA